MMENINVVIADDHEMVRKGIRSWLEAERDITVIAETNKGLDVSQKLAEFSPDVLLLDLHLPDLHGLDVIRRLRDAKNDTPILVMTGYEKQRAKAVLEAGANGFLNKEESRERILDAVRWAAERKSGVWLSPSIVSEFMEADKEIEKAGLTKTEIRVLGLIEKQNAEIAKELFLSEGTIKNHISNIYSKLGVSSRVEAAAWARKSGLLETRK
jgi:two-component system, NarL family, response regulator DegU